MSEVRVAVALGGASVEVQGDREFVEAQIKRLLPLITGEGGSTVTPAKEPAHTAPASGDAHAAPRLGSIGGFFEQKKPGNAYEAIAVAMFHRLKTEQKIEMSWDEIKTALTQGRFRPPESFQQALTDCRRRYGYIEVGSKKGFWKLTHSGETVVDFDLPKNG
jgi:hypothetical protein